MLSGEVGRCDNDKYLLFTIRQLNKLKSYHTSVYICTLHTTHSADIRKKVAGW